MSSPQLEKFLAALYTDAALRQRFLQAPQQVALQAGLSNEEAQALTQIDRIGLQMAASSFARKRAAHKPRLSWWKRLRQRLQHKLGW